MRNNPYQPASQSRSGPGSIKNFSNYYNPNISRTHNVSPNTLSPPPGLNSGSGIHKLNSNANKLNPDNIKSRMMQQNLRQRNLQNYNGQMSNKYANKSNNKKDFISMQQALGMLNYINMNSNQAFKNENLPLQQIQQHYQNQPQPRKLVQPKQVDLAKKYSAQTLTSQQNGIQSINGQQQSEVQSDDAMSLTQTKKKLNKNRAIKRIIQTAYDILQKNYHFIQSDQQLKDDQRSTSTQFNIYLKQYNRIIQQINSKEFEEIEKANKLYDQNEEQLQEVFEYTVMDDFRQKLSVMFNKQKVSKNNVNIMVTAFRDALVSLKLNQLRVQFMDSQQPPKTIKMSQIQNVQYFTHPYIFLVLTINKDKTKSKQHLYLKFTSQQNQDKWDRALYCCFMSRKMNKKERLFEIQFPVEDVMKKQKEQYRKNQQQYELYDQLSVIDKCFRERQMLNNRSPTSNNPTLDNQNENNMLSDRPEYMNFNKNRNLTEQKIPINNQSPQSEQMKRNNTFQNKSSPSKYDNPFKGIQLNTNNKNQQNSPSFGGQNQSDINSPPKRQLQLNDQQSQHSGNLSKKSTFNQNNTISPNNSNNNTMNDPSRSNTFPYNSPTASQNPNKGSTNPFMKLLKIAEQESQKQKQKNKLQQQKNQKNLQNEKKTNEKIQKLKRIRQIQKNNVRGVVCQKQKFFMNKQKLIFFYDQSLLNSSRRTPNSQTQQQRIQQLKDISNQQLQSNKFLQYWDYDYKKDNKQQRKLIPVIAIKDYQIIPSQLGQTTTSILLTYDFINSDKKIDKKQLRLIFANGISNNTQNNISKAYQVYEWIKLIKEI